MSYKKKLTLLVDETVIERARRLGLNLSQYFELKLGEYVKNFGKSGSHTNYDRTPISRNLCEGWDLNPRTPTGQDLKSCTFNLALLPSRGAGLYSGGK